MSINRIMVVVPVVAGLFVTGTAVARMAPFATDVRDSVYGSAYQTCAHNGVHFNKQGHPNCGLHKGWQQGGGNSTPSTPGSEGALQGGGKGHQHRSSHSAHGGPGHHGHSVSVHHGGGRFARHGSKALHHGGHGKGHSKKHG